MLPWLMMVAAPLATVMPYSAPEMMAPVPLFITLPPACRYTPAPVVPIIVPWLLTVDA